MKSALIWLLVLSMIYAYEPSTYSLTQANLSWCRKENNRFDLKTICHTLMSDPIPSYVEGLMISSSGLKLIMKSNSKCMSIGGKKMYTCLPSIVKVKKSELSFMKIIKGSSSIESSI